MARRVGIEIFMVLVIGFVLGLFGPFGTFEMAPAMRIAFWMVYTLLGYAIFRPVIAVGKWMSAALSLPQIIGVGLALVVGAAPLTFMIALLFNGFDVGRTLLSSQLPSLYFQVWLIGFLINGFFALAFPNKAEGVVPDPVLPPPATLPEPPKSEPPTPSIKPATPHFSDRLPAGFGPLLALKGEDHYVRAIGGQREELILIRLRDAIAELGEMPGMLVHRSWWVARDAVTSVRRDGRSATLILANGTQVPVARDKTGQLKAAGIG